MSDVSVGMLVLAGWAVLGMMIAGAVILKPADQGGYGLFLAILFGPLGLIIAWAMRENFVLERARNEARQLVTAPDARTEAVPTPLSDTDALLRIKPATDAKPGSAEAEGEVARLDALRAQGIVSQREFDRRRAELLGLRQ